MTVVERSAAESVDKAFKSLEIDLSRISPDKIIDVGRELMDRYGDADLEKATQGVAITSHVADGIACEYLTPLGDDVDDARRVLMIHGGGWLSGTLRGYRAFGATLAKFARMPVLVADYRLAPENKFPAGLEDCERAFSWAWENGPAGAHRADAVTLVGDSAGANLSAALCVKRIQAKARLPDRLALVSPMLDLALRGYKAPRDPIVCDESVDSSVKNYVLEGTDTRQPLICPYNATEADLAAFPPTMLQVSAVEHFLDGSQRFAGKLSAQNVRNILSVWPNMPHVWHQFIDLLPEALLAIEELGQFLRVGACPT